MTGTVARIRVPTEVRNPRTLAIDTGTTLSMLEQLNAEDALVAGAVERVLPALAEAVDLAVERIHAGGRVHYFGAGTSVVSASSMPSSCCRRSTRIRPSSWPTTPVAMRH